VTQEEAEPGLGEGPAKAISVSLPEGTVRALRDYAGNRGVSALVAVAIEEHLRNQATREYLADFEDEHGPFTGAERQAATDIWSAAERRESRWHEAV